MYYHDFLVLNLQYCKSPFCQKANRIQIDIHALPSCLNHYCRQNVQLSKLEILGYNVVSWVM